VFSTIKPGWRIVWLFGSCIFLLTRLSILNVFLGKNSVIVSAPTIDTKSRILARITVILYSVYRTPPRLRRWSVCWMSFDQFRYSFASIKTIDSFIYENILELKKSLD